MFVIQQQTHINYVILEHGRSQILAHDLNIRVMRTLRHLLAIPLMMVVSLQRVVHDTNPLQMAKHVKLKLLPLKTIVVRI